mmetsp:Transcript_26020/g.86700  ORF Transcript_26020/g.86700 Transcript_26020/m.86700 type:complete len:278 (+) Transcript_26020:809-1642(+)
MASRCRASSRADPSCASASRSPAACSRFCCSSCAAARSAWPLACSASTEEWTVRSPCVSLSICVLASVASRARWTDSSRRVPFSAASALQDASTAPLRSANRSCSASIACCCALLLLAASASRRAAAEACDAASSSSCLRVSLDSASSLATESLTCEKEVCIHSVSRLRASAMSSTALSVCDFARSTARATSSRSAAHSPRRETSSSSTTLDSAPIDRLIRVISALRKSKTFWLSRSSASCSRAVCSSRRTASLTRWNSVSLADLDHDASVGAAYMY